MRREMKHHIHIIGGGLAGSEAAWQLAEMGHRIRLSEMRGGGDMTPAHETDRLAEMVCSNSFRSDDAENNAVGLLHQEMRALDSLVMRAADQHRVPAGSALAVDRDGFADEVTKAIERHPNIHVFRERIDALPDHPAIIATGPLTGSALAGAIANETGSDALAFFGHRAARQASTKARITAVSPGLMSYSGCHCTPRQKLRSGSSMASITPSGARAVTTTPGPRVSAAW